MSNTVGNAEYLNSIGVVSCFGEFVESEEQEIVKRVVFLNWVGRWRDLEVGNVRDEDLGGEKV